MNRTLNIIGGGKVGKTLGYLLCKASRYHIQHIVCTSAASCLESQQFIGEGIPTTWDTPLTLADALLIAVPDDRLPHVVSHLTQLTSLPTLIFHTSGSHSHEILLPLKRDNVIASIHPMRSFADPATLIEHFSGTYCTIEGDTPACQWLREDLEAINANVIQITSEKKSLIHIASIFSSNYVIALIDSAVRLLAESGIPPALGVDMLTPLLLGSWEQLKNLGSERALTGPISRGDSMLIERHIRLLAEKDSQLATVYRTLGQLTLDLAMRGKRLDAEQQERISKILSAADAGTIP